MTRRKKNWRYVVYKDDTVIAYTTTKAEAESEAKKRGTHYVDQTAKLSLERPRHTPEPKRLRGRGSIRPRMFQRPFRRKEGSPQGEMFAMSEGVSFDVGDVVSSRSNSFPGTKVILEMGVGTAKVAQGHDSRRTYIAMVEDLVLRSRKRRNPPEGLYWTKASRYDPKEHLSVPMSDLETTGVAGQVGWVEPSRAAGETWRGDPTSKSTKWTGNFGTNFAGPSAWTYHGYASKSKAKTAVMAAWKKYKRDAIRVLERGETPHFRKRRNPVRKVKGGWQWGTSGKVYKRKSDAEKQAKAIYASGWRENPNLFSNPEAFVNYQSIGDYPRDQAFEAAIKVAESEGATKLGPPPKVSNPPRQLKWRKRYGGYTVGTGRNQLYQISPYNYGGDDTGWLVYFSDKGALGGGARQGRFKTVDEAKARAQAHWDHHSGRHYLDPEPIRSNPQAPEAGDRFAAQHQQFGMFGPEARALEQARAGIATLPVWAQQAVGHDFDEERDVLEAGISDQDRRRRQRFRKSRTATSHLGKTPTGKDRIEIHSTGSLEPLVDFVFDTRTESEPGIKFVLDPFTSTNTSARKYRQPGRWTVKVEGLPEIYRGLRQLPTLSTYHVAKYKSGMKKAQLERLWRGSQSVKKAAKDRKLAERGVEIAERKAQGGLERVMGAVAPYQDTGIPFLMQRKKAILADDMGLGKTYQAIVAANNVVPKRQQILVIAPAAVVGNWAKDDIPNLGGATAVVGSASNIPTTNAREARFVVVSYGSATYQVREGVYARLGRHLLKEHWGCVIFDEAHRLKHTGTERHNFAEKLHSDRLWLLTGTPQANRPRDWYGMLKMIQHPLGASFAEFKKEFGKRKPSLDAEKRRQQRHKRKWEDANRGVHPALQTKFKPLADRPSNFGKFGEVLSPWILRRMKETEIPHLLPEKIRKIVDVTDIPESLQTRKVGQSFAGKREHLAVVKVAATWSRVTKLLAKRKKVVIFSMYTKPLLMFIKKAKDCGIPVVEVRGQGDWSGQAKKRIAKLLFQGEFYPHSFKHKDGTFDPRAWRSAQRFVEGQYPRGVWFNQRRVPTSTLQDYTPDQQARMFPVFVGQMVAASEGITLHKAKDLFINDLSYMPSQLLQSEDRIYRIGAAKYRVIDSEGYETLVSTLKKANALAAKVGGTVEPAPANIWYMLGHSVYDRRVWALLNKKMQQADEIYGALKDPDKAKKELERQEWDDLQGGRRLPIELRRNPVEKKRKGKVSLQKRELLILSEMACPVWPEHGRGDKTI